MGDTYLLRKAEIEAMDGLAKTHFLNDNARRTNKSLGDATGLTGLGFHLIEVEPGRESTELHAHRFEDECVYVLSGSGLATIGEEEHAIGEGDFVGYRAGGLAHRLVATGPVPLRCLVVGQRLAHDVGDYPRLGKRLYRNDGEPWELVDHDDVSYPSGGAKR